MKRRRNLTFYGIAALIIITIFSINSAIIFGQNTQDIKVLTPSNLNTDIIRAIFVTTRKRSNIGTIYVGTSNGRVMLQRMDVNNNNMQPFSQFNPVTDIQSLIRDIYFVNENDGYLLENDGIYEYGSDKKFSNLIVEVRDLPQVRNATPRLYSMNFISDRKVCIGGAYIKTGTDNQIAEQLILCTDNINESPQIWKRPENLPSEPLQITSVNFADNSRGWAVGTEGTILYTEDGGESWLKQSDGLGLEDPLMSVYALRNGKAWVVGYNSQVWFKTPKKQQNTVVDEESFPAFKEGDRVIVKKEVSEKVFTARVLQTMVTLPQMKGRVISVNQRERKLRVKLDKDLPTGYKFLQDYIRDNDLDFEDVEKESQTTSVVTTTTITKPKEWQKISIAALTTKKEILRNIKFASHDENEDFGWIVGDKGTILYTDNGGETWQPVDFSNLPRAQKMQIERTNFYSIFVDENYCWIAGSNGTIVQIKYR